jgi:hypothetical protein
MFGKLDTKTFIEKANVKHKNRYLYYNTEYVGIQSLVIVTCREHGDFNIRAFGHLHGGAGCKKCRSIKQSSNQIMDNKECLIRFNKIHGDRYDYSKVIYLGIKIKVIIGCEEHGEFMQAPQKHWIGRGCPICANKKRNISITKTKEYFVERAKNIHGDLYDYNKSNYISAQDKITINCHIHGDFIQKAYSHLNGRGCPKCRNNSNSKQEKEVLDYIKSLYSGEIIENDRKILEGKELDIVIPEKNIAIEYCGLYWHSETMGKDRNYHLDKLKKCNDKGYRLITIFSDEWTNKTPIIKSKLKSILGIGGESIYARKCVIKEVDTKTKGEFLDQNHIQGRMLSNINIGLFYEDKLVSVLTFIKKEEKYDLSRFASSVQVVGGFSKMLSYFTRKYDPKHIYTFADLRYSEGNLYAKTGFEEVYRTKPNYFYFRGNNRHSRVAFQKHKLSDKLEIFDPSKTEVQNMEDNGYDRIFDCGNIKFEMIF